MTFSLRVARVNTARLCVFSRLSRLFVHFLSGSRAAVKGPTQWGLRGMLMCLRDALHVYYVEGCAV